MHETIIKALCEKIERLEVKLESYERIIDHKQEEKNEFLDKYNDCATKMNSLLDENSKLKKELEEYRKTKEEISQVMGEIRKQTRGRPKKVEQ